jgi:hypothetical protein
MIPDNPTPGPVEQYLRFVAMSRQMSSQGPTIESFVLEHGREWQAAKRPAGLRKRRNQMCFMNATHLMQEDESLTYVEGYAARFFPTIHAWCVTPDGIVVDLTWPDPQNSHYFGVPFQREFVRATICKREYYGVLDNPQQDWPLIRGVCRPEKFLHHIAATATTKGA